jgi:hypothetical protein
MAKGFIISEFEMGIAMRRTDCRITMRLIHQDILNDEPVTVNDGGILIFAINFDMLSN